MPNHRGPLAQLGLPEEPVTNRSDSALLLSDELGGYQAIITRGSAAAALSAHADAHLRQQRRQNIAYPIGLTLLAAVIYTGCWVLIAQLRQIVPILSETPSPFFPAFMLWSMTVALLLVPTTLRAGAPDLGISGALFPAPRDHQSDVPVLKQDALVTTMWETGAELTESQRDALLADDMSLRSLEGRDRERARTRRADARVARGDQIREWAEQEFAAHPLRWRLQVHGPAESAARAAREGRDVGVVQAAGERRGCREVGRSHGEQDDDRITGPCGAGEQTADRSTVLLPDRSRPRPAGRSRRRQQRVGRTVAHQEVAAREVQELQRPLGLPSGQGTVRGEGDDAVLGYLDERGVGIRRSVGDRRRHAPERGPGGGVQLARLRMRIPSTFRDRSEGPQLIPGSRMRSRDRVDPPQRRRPRHDIVRTEPKRRLR